MILTVTCQLGPEDVAELMDISAEKLKKNTVGFNYIVDLCSALTAIREQTHMQVVYPIVIEEVHLSIAQELRDVLS